MKEADYASAMGRTISKVSIVNNALVIVFDCESKLSIWDGGQECCESRYMDTDDDLNFYVGSIFLGVDISEVEYKDTKSDDYHDQVFVRILTTRGDFTLVTHNEHNGYYGGFDLQSKFLRSTKANESPFVDIMKLLDDQNA